MPRIAIFAPVSGEPLGFPIAALKRYGIPSKAADQILGPGSRFEALILRVERLPEMQATATEQISELMLSWVNEQLRNEAARREQIRVTAEVVNGDWQRRAATVLTIATWGLCWLVIRTFA